ncbi:MAG: hypothetical protein K0Q50_2829, partial [Vampirovibrio sp.]|nr:hypothetical protein [Vampirovibrio sp.]
MSLAPDSLHGGASQNGTSERSEAMYENLPEKPRSRFMPLVPKTLEETGLTSVVVEDLIFKVMLAKGAMSGREIAADICLHFTVVEPLLSDLKARLLVYHKTSSGVGDFIYMLTETGQEKAMIAREISAYAGAAPVPFADYLAAISAQSIRNEKPDFAVLAEAFKDLIFDSKLFDTIGPAINSGRGLFLYGEPGNGKTTIAEKLAQCFSNDIFIPKAIFVEGQILQLFDPQNHHPTESAPPNALIARYDQRWIEIKRPA